MLTEQRKRSIWNFLRPLKIDFYLLGEVVGPFFGGMIFFTFIFLMFQTLRLAEVFIVHGVSGAILLKMCALLSLQFLPAALPVAFLIAVLMAFGRLSSDSELIALKASGLSLLRLAAPVLVFSIAVSALSLSLNTKWVPWAERESHDLTIRVSNTKVASSIKEGTFTSGFFDLLVYAEKVDVKTNRLKRVFIYDEREADNPMTVVARSGEILPIKVKTELGAAILLNLYNGSIHPGANSDKSYQKMDFGKYQLYLKIDEGSPNSSSKPKFISQPELIKVIERTDPRSTEGREMRGEFWRRYAMAFSPVLFVFLGIGFGTIRTRAVRAGAALVAFVTLLLYWTIQTYALMAVFEGTLSPALAMQLPNLAVLVAAAISFKRAAW
jgi:lipopolysaccharide export system permease protein